MFFKKEEAENAFQSIEKRNRDLQLLELKAQLDGLKQYINEKEGKHKTLEKQVESFCREFLDQEFAISQIGGAENNILNMNVSELINFTGKKLGDLIKESDKKITFTVNELIKKNQEVEHLQRQIFLLKKDGVDLGSFQTEDTVTKSLEKEIPEKNEIKTKDISMPPQADINMGKVINNEILASVRNSFETIIKKSIEDTPQKEEVPVKVIEIDDKDLASKVNLKTSLNIGQKKEDKVIGHLVDLNKIMNTMPEIHWQILEAIGEKGLSEKDDIINYLIEKNSTLKANSLSVKVGAALGEMRVSDAIKLHKINTGSRTFYAYSLTDTGRRMFIESGKFKEAPVLSEVEILERDHNSAYHGYGIKDSSEIIKELGYTEVTTGRKENTVQLPNGDDYIPDIKARSPFTGEFEYFEYELGHHKQSDFDRKCTKMRLASKTLHFIVPDITKRTRVKNQIDDWRFKAGDRAKDVEIKITTTRNLKKGMWDTDF